MNGMAIVTGLEHLSVFLCTTGTVQQKGYDYIIEQLKKDVGADPKRTMPSFENMDGFGYTIKLVAWLTKSVFGVQAPSVAVGGFALSIFLPSLHGTHIVTPFLQITMFQ